MEKLTKSRPPLAQLAKQDIKCIMYAKQLKGGSKKVSEWYKIGSPKCNKIWNKFEKAEIAPKLTPQEIITPEEPKPEPME
ncbi:17798_t:CDS:2, partial [Dentiscutata erythropus]